MSTDRPAPEPDELTRPYWQAARDGQAVLPRCSACGRFDLPPDIVCRRCGTTEPAWTWEPVSGRGTVRSWTLVRQAFLPGLDPPYVVADVELDEQQDLRTIGRLADADPGRLAIGDRVVTAFEPAGEWAVPVFHLETA